MTIVFVAVFIYNVIRPAKSHSAYGMVDGVAYSTKVPSVLIDGHILREAETIYGVTVGKIFKNKVEFEKDGVTWIQRVGERPDPAWQKYQQQQIQNDADDG